MLMADKMGKISLECSRQAMDLNSGLSNILGATQVLHIVLQKENLTVKKSLLPNSQLELSPLSMLR
jgi:hypothetical protein